MKRAVLVTVFILIASPLLADNHAIGDAEEGANQFRKCKSCHAIVDPEGVKIVKGGRTGPNLYGIIGRQAGTVAEYRYGDDLVAAGEAGLIWDEANLAEYSRDPRKFLRAYLDDSGARSKMSFKMRRNAEDVAAYLASIAPPVEATDEAASSD